MPLPSKDLINPVLAIIASGPIWESTAPIVAAPGAASLTAFIAKSIFAVSLRSASSGILFLRLLSNLLYSGSVFNVSSDASITSATICCPTPPMD